MKSKKLKISTGWWQIGFNIYWPKNQEIPDMHIDLCIAHMVLLPLIKEHEISWQAYRFHRRAENDSTGHLFSFLFYTDSIMAKVFFDKIKSNEIIGSMISSGKIVELTINNSDKNKYPNLEDISDLTWPDSIRKSWPSYIMGVSKTWISLIDEIIFEHSEWPMPSRWVEADSFYKKVESEITKIWQDKGRHIYLHHLNAIFGYKSLVIYEKKFMNF